LTEYDNANNDGTNKNTELDGLYFQNTFTIYCKGANVMALLVLRVVKCWLRNTVEVVKYVVIQRHKYEKSEIKSQK